jgi:hypothetical protein
VSTKDRGKAIHFAVAFLVGAVSMIGIGREIAQHSWAFALNAHQLAEALAWPAGAFTALCLGLLVLRLIKGKW